MVRFLAFLILFIPGVFAAIGIKLMRDMVFGLLKTPFPSLTIQFICGFIFMVAGVGFIAGFILHRDRKRSKVQKRFSTRRNV
ncbi:DUF2627 domain-containing protein [Bacillus sp. 1P06AnD]|uniref:DUF2627 domain-containing protein n=1 Tax=Bacillus sp. 1P06AnD TaxID=3132208 RepID=UPI0039A37959